MESEKQRGRSERLASLRIERGEEPRPRAGRPWTWIVGAALLVLAGWWLWRALSRPGPVEVTTAVAEEVVLAAGGATVLNATGYVTARLQATVSSKVTGRVVEVLIEEGMEVDAGQLMARVDASNLRVQLDLARAQERAARTALEETKVREAEARLDLERVVRLVADDISSQADLDAAQAGHDALVARLAQQRDQVGVASREVAVWEQQLADTEIRAPFAGVVVSKNAQPGEMISPAAAGGGFTRTGIGTVVDMSSLEIEVDVNESYINRVTAGQEVVATLDAYADWQIPAHVIAIVPTADRQRATVKVRIGFEELDPRILPDMGVKVAFRSGAGGDGGSVAQVLVPLAALRRIEGRDAVLVVDDESIARRRVVATGGEHEGRQILLSGVSAGEIVVVDAPDEMAGGERVTVVRAEEGSD